MYKHISIYVCAVGHLEPHLGYLGHHLGYLEPHLGYHKMGGGGARAARRIRIF